MVSTDREKMFSLPARTEFVDVFRFFQLLALVHLLGSNFPVRNVDHLKSVFSIFFCSVCEYVVRAYA